MTAQKVIWAWPWEVNPDMGQWEAKPSIVGEGIRYTRDDAPELVALVEAAKQMRKAFIPFADDEFAAVYALDAALAAWEALK